MKRDTRQFKIETANNNDIQFYQFYNYPLVLVYRKKRIIIDSGTGDTIKFFYLDKNRTVLMSTNSKIECAGIQVINFKTGRIEQEIFFQSVNDHSQLGDCLKKDFFDYSSNSQAKILMQYAG